ncbi:hypothetical protein J2850_005807 [Azospirillum picis]|uniref:Uncharacterized protein n=1 Tax=Azospirillum picis TaxID=488438 RepID=A0ABU0MTQ1_9PROT|nr:hypothetical protein [Azospirillum picis]MDQ0536822.1 hypothetical protein [Azospirillum picis]
MPDRRPALSVCIVTHEVAGLAGSGGIGCCWPATPWR